MEKVTVIIPFFNEHTTIGKVVLEIPKTYEIVVVDDGSEGDFPRVQHKGMRLITNRENRGKGFSIRHGLQFIRGGITVITDADTELSPSDIPALIKPILSGKADVVFGSRFLNTESRRVLGFWHFILTKAFTIFSNMISGIYLTDTNCGMKAFRTDLLKSLKLKEDRFGFDPEVVAKVAKTDARIYEVAVSYNHRRTRAEGKKIRYRDVFRHLYCIIRYA